MAIVRAVGATSGRAVAPRALALVSAVATGAAIVFAPNGLRARDLVAIMHTSPAARLALWTAWTVLATPSVAAAFDAPGTRSLRSLRLGRAHVVILTVLVVAIQAPWGALFARAEGAAAGAHASLLAAALCTSACVLRRPAPGAVVFAGAATLAMVDASAWLTLVPALGAAYVGTATAWRHALERRPSLRIVRRAPAAIALASTYLVRVVRVARARLHASATIMLAAGGALVLTLRNDPDARPLQRTLVVLALPLTIVCGLLAKPVVETEARLKPLLRSTRTRPVTLLVAATLALAAPSSAFAATAGVVAAHAAHVTSTLPVAAFGWAVAIALSVAVWARRSARLFLGAVLIAALFTAGAALC